MPFQRWRGVDSPPGSGREYGNIDDRLWACAASVRAGHADPDIEAVIGELDLTAFGPLVPQGSAKTIEVWTASDLGGLQALGWLAHLLGRGDLLSKAFETCRWHIEHTQPDNATNRPWGIHLFVVMSELNGCSTARLYAETLLHNCMVTHATPDALSAEILRDAADALDAIEWADRADL